MAIPISRTDVQKPLIPLYVPENFGPLPSQTDLIVIFCQFTNPEVLKKESSKNLVDRYVIKFKKLEPSDQLEVLARISNDYFVLFFFSKLPKEIRTGYIEIASSIVETNSSLHPTQLRLDAIAQYRRELSTNPS